MNRRGFLSSILALAAAPAIVRADSLMRIVPRELVIDDLFSNVTLLAMNEGDFTIEGWAKDGQIGMLTRITTGVARYTGSFVAPLPLVPVENDGWHHVAISKKGPTQTFFHEGHVLENLSPRQMEEARKLYGLGAEYSGDTR